MFQIRGRGPARFSSRSRLLRLITSISSCGEGCRVSKCRCQRLSVVMRLESFANWGGTYPDSCQVSGSRSIQALPVAIVNFVQPDSAANACPGQWLEKTVTAHTP